MATVGFVVELKRSSRESGGTSKRQLPGLKRHGGLRVVGGRQTAAGHGELYVADPVLQAATNLLLFKRHAVAQRGDKLEAAPRGAASPTVESGYHGCPMALLRRGDGQNAERARRAIGDGNNAAGRRRPRSRHTVSFPIRRAGSTFPIKAAFQAFATIRSPSFRSEVRCGLPTTPSMQIKIYDSAKGKLLQTMGKEGGQQIRAIVPTDFWRPAGLRDRCARSRLWVTEMSNQPKRVSVWATFPTISENQAV